MSQRINFINQQDITEERVKVGWRRKLLSRGEFYLESLDLSGMALPENATVYLKVKWSGFGVKTTKLGTCLNPLQGGTIEFDEDFLPEASVSIFVTSVDRHRTKIAISNPSLVVSASNSRANESLLPRQRSDELGDVLWRLKVTPAKFILLINRDWPEPFDYTGNARFNAIDLPDILRQIAIVVADKNTEINDEVRDSWVRLFCQYTIPPPISTGPDASEEIERWAFMASKAITQSQSLKDKFLKTGES